MQHCRLWSAHVDALDRHLSANRWALAAVTVVMIAYPIVRIVIPAIFHGIVPDVVRTVLKLI
jgi:preprotein translocase subunit SecD